MNTSLGSEVVLSESFQDALARTREALKGEGFGILTEVDLQRTFREKLGLEFRPYVMLGACNPPLAYRALTSAPEVGLLLPCNVTVEARVEGGGSLVRLVNPELLLSVGNLGAQPQMQAIAADARTRLGRVAESLRRPGPPAA
ncbi:MAG: DUF302 domain-containing protein [Gammaproteobacteria bacterium]